MPLGESVSPGTGTGLGMALSSYPSGIIPLIKSNESLTRTNVAPGLLEYCNAPLPVLRKEAALSAAAGDNLTVKHKSHSNVRQIGKLCA